MERKSFKWMIVDLMFMYIVTGLGLILMAFLMEKFQLNGTFVEVGVTVIYVVSGIAGGLIAGKKMKRKKFLWGLLLGSLYFLILFAVISSIGRRASERSGTYGNDTWDLYGGRNTWGHDELKNAFQLKNIML